MAADPKRINTARREFLQKGAAAAASSLGMMAFPSCSGSTGQVSLTAALTGNEAAWSFSGSRDWTQDGDGILYSPVWNQYRVRKKGNDLLKREDFAYPSQEALSDTDISVEFRTYYWSVLSTGIAFRAQDSHQLYLVEFYDTERKGPQYSVRLFVQDGFGYRREIAAGFAPHPELPERWVQRGPKADEWEQATPGWAKARVLAQGDRIQVFMDGKATLDVRDATYPAGRAGIVARGPVNFRRLQVSGKRDKRTGPWEASREERPPYFYPWPDTKKEYGDNQTYPGCFRMADGRLGVWIGVTGDPHAPDDILLVWSRDEGATWGDPMLFKKRPDLGKPGYFFGHQDGRLSCLYATTYDWDKKSGGVHIAFSSNGGKTWTPPKPLVVSGKPLNAHASDGTIGPYSPIIRYSDGTLLQYYYHVQTIKGGSQESNAERRDRSLVIRSTDDGKTWTGPHYLDAENFDSNETMGAELADGKIVAFSRTLRSPFMWMSTSADKGLTWSKQTQSNCTGECPFLLRHSNGVLVMGSRGAGIFMKTSIDDGKTWSREVRISLCSGMMGMIEMKDGRVLVVFHEAYRTPTRVRGHYMRVEKNGNLLPA